MRIEWQLEGFLLPRESIHGAFAAWAHPRGAKFRLYFSDVKPRLALFVSKLDHCLHDLLLRHRAGEFEADIPLVVSNHEDLGETSRLYGIPFHVFPITKENKAEQERAELELLRKERIDTIILARYMQVLSQQMIDAYPHEILNIHHSFLPAFAGGRPYQQAHRRGVKIIGATSHYVTADLDEGPIIEQDVARVSHRDSVDDLVRKGRDLEKLVLGRAVRLHLSRRVLVQENRTVVFE
jgi:formyltetrahydrofolate deformylase